MVLTAAIASAMIPEMADETARNTIDILNFFSFPHFDAVSEEILKQALPIY
jgi:hypothetical protein